MCSEAIVDLQTHVSSVKWSPCDDDEDVADDDGGQDEGEGRADGRRVQEEVAAVRRGRTDVGVNLHPQPTALGGHLNWNQRMILDRMSTLTRGLVSSNWRIPPCS